MKPQVLFSRGIETLSYLSLSAPGNEGVNIAHVARGFAELANIVKLAADYVKTEDARRYLSFCGEELVQTQAAYGAGNRAEFLRCLDSARSWFEKARNDSKSKARFIADADGHVKESGDVTRSPGSKRADGPPSPR